MVTFKKMDVTYEKPTPTPVYYGPANPIQLVPNPTPLCQTKKPYTCDGVLANGDICGATSMVFCRCDWYAPAPTPSSLP